MSRVCRICNKPIVLVPSAAQRAKKFGGTAKYYEDLFLEHSDCTVGKRDEEVRELMKRLEEKG